MPLHFMPRLKRYLIQQFVKKPVVVLSNNDGCIVAASPEARALGIPKFEPYFKLRQILEQNDVIIRSSNYELYAVLFGAALSCPLGSVLALPPL
ncbi:DNA polymerase V [Pseudoalteromonas citrea]|uniref:DNA polymerase V n=1 Tax=Pseudoalteromonas citrea TaxID=43655 RepID=A0AAD4AI24_9GAMM|nr:DNA polymerase V [Pseudoalteromonas citrea]